MYAHAAERVSHHVVVQHSPLLDPSLLPQLLLRFDDPNRVMSTRRTVVRPSTSQRATSSTKRRQDENQLADQPAAAAPMPTGRLSRAPLKASLLNQNNPRSTEVVVPSKRPAKGPPKDEEEGGFNIQVAVRLRCVPPQQLPFVLSSPRLISLLVPPF